MYCFKYGYDECYQCLHSIHTHLPLYLGRQITLKNSSDRKMIKQCIYPQICFLKSRGI